MTIPATTNTWRPLGRQATHAACRATRACDFGGNVRRSKVFDEQFWANAGTSPITGLSSGSVVWFTPTTGTAGSVHTTAVTGDWMELNLGGKVDKLYVVYRSKITALGGLANVTGANVTPLAVGQLTTKGITVFDTPHEVSYIPSAVTSASGGSRAGGNLLACVFWEGGTAQPPVSTSDAASYSGGGIFGEASPNATNELFGWTFEIMPRYSAAAVGGAANPIASQSLAGVEKVWLSIGTFQTMTGTLATTQLEGYIRVIGFEETNK